MGTRIYLLMEGKLESSGQASLEAYLNGVEPLMAKHGVGIWAMGDGINILPNMASWPFNLMFRFPDVATAEDFFGEADHQTVVKTHRDQAFRELSVSLFKVELFGGAPRPNWLVAMERGDDKPKKEPRSISRKVLGTGRGMSTAFTNRTTEHLVIQVFDHEDGLKRYFENRNFPPHNLTVFKARLPPNRED